MVLRAFKVIISKSGTEEDGREDLLSPKSKADEEENTFGVVVVVDVGRQRQKKFLLI